MNVTFMQGPLDGQVRDVPEGDLAEGSVILLPSGDPDDGPTIPGDETTLEYRYDGDGRASYVAGVAPSTEAGANEAGANEARATDALDEMP
jgi:hypothetical protein